MISDPLYRQDEIVRLCAGKTVLHLGFIMHDQWRDRLKDGNWLHARLISAAARVVGLDYLKDEVDEIRQTVGCECVVGDCLDLDEVDLDETFDVIVCGELIEHLESPRDMLDGLRRFCSADSIVIITTPNPWDRKWIAKTRSGIDERIWLNPEHVCWFSMETLRNILTRCGYEVIRAERSFEERLELDATMTTTQRIYWHLKRIARRLATRPDCQPGLFFVVRPNDQPNGNT